MNNKVYSNSTTASKNILGKTPSLTKSQLLVDTFSKMHDDSTQKLSLTTKNNEL
jgi:hypothetical protein